METIATTTTTNNDDHKIQCPSCKMPARAKQMIEKLPGDGELWRVEHDGGKVCQWARYKSPYDVHLSKKEADYVFDRIRPKDDNLPSQQADTNWKAMVLSKLDKSIDLSIESLDLLRNVIRMLLDVSPSSVTTNSNIEKVEKKKGTDRSISSKEITKQKEVPPIPSNYKQVKPVNKTLTTCEVCRKPGYMYHTVATQTKKRMSYFIHYNEPPIGWVTNHGKPIRLKFRKCHRTTETTAS